MDILRDETVVALTRVGWMDGQVAAEARREAERRGLLPGDAGEAA